MNTLFNFQSLATGSVSGVQKAFLFPQHANCSFCERRLSVKRTTTELFQYSKCALERARRRFWWTLSPLRPAIKPTDFSRSVV